MSMSKSDGFGMAGGAKAIILIISLIIGGIQGALIGIAQAILKANTISKSLVVSISVLLLLLVFLVPTGLFLLVYVTVAAGVFIGLGASPLSNFLISGLEASVENNDVR
jgi:hypothetical protein